MSTLPTGGSRSEQATPQPSPSQPTSSYPGMQPPPSQQRDSPRELPMTHPVLPPLRQLSSTPPTPSSQRHGDPFLQILNPEQDMRDQQRNRRRSASQMDSPSPVQSSTSQSLPSISRPNSVDSTQEEHLPPRPFQPPGRPIGRHILDAKSPALRKAQSISFLNAPTGTIDAHQSPFLTASTRPSETTISHQHSPTPPTTGRHSYFPPVSNAGSLLPHTVIRSEIRRPSVGFSQSGSASPIHQYSPYSQPGSVASSQFDTPSTPGHHGTRAPSGPGHESRLSVGSMEVERNMISMAPANQSSYQLMTIKSQQGHNVQIPVDVTAASKVADEKRRRNAGASARFRARRKEKEREASMSISRLEQQLRNALEDAEFYRVERDHFKNIVFQQHRDERHYARPTSPRLRRPSIAPSHAASSTRGGSEESFLDYEEEAREEERIVRRRTSNYHPASGPPPVDVRGSDVGLQSYSSGFSSSNHVTQDLPPVQQYSPHDRAHPHGQQSVALEAPMCRAPVASNHERYEQSSWAPQVPSREP